nr:uncharacterized protein LOC111429286 [Onthophagus taurus]
MSTFTIVFNTINNVMIKQELEKATKAAKEVETIGYQRFLEAKLATETELKLSREVVEKTKNLIKGMIQQHEQNHEYILSTLYSVEESVQNLKDAMDLLKLEDNMESMTQEFVDLLRKFFKEANHLDKIYQEFSNYGFKPEKYDKDSLINFVIKNLDGETFGIIRSLQRKLVNNKGLFHLASYVGVEKYILYTRSKSSLQFILNLFSYYVLIEIRTLVVISFSKNVATHIEPKTNMYWQDHKEYDLEVDYRVKNTLEMLQFHSNYVTGRYWVYDSYKNPIGHNYVTFTNFMRGFILRGSKCSEIGNSKNDDEDKRNDEKDEDFNCTISNPNKCEGELIPVDDPINFSKRNRSVMNVCFSRKENRNYDYVKFNKGPKNAKCSGTSKIFPYLEGCESCFFLCYDHFENSSDRYISLDEMVTNITEKRIITGVRFNKHNGVIGIDIQETQIDKAGCALLNTTKWIINKGKKLFALNPTKLHLYLGEIRTNNKNRVVTGLRFEEIADGLQLQVRFHELIKCAQNSTLVASTLNWITTEKSARRIDVSNKEVPNHHSDLSLPIKSFGNSKIRIGASDFESDGAQTTVPFFDTREVVCEPPVALWGIGWIYKGESEYYSGYVAPYLISANYLYDIDMENLLNLAERSNDASILQVTKRENPSKNNGIDAWK